MLVTHTSKLLSEAPLLHSFTPSLLILGETELRSQRKSKDNSYRSSDDSLRFSGSKVASLSGFEDLTTSSEFPSLREGLGVGSLSTNNNN